MPTPRPRLTPGIRLVDAVMRASPSFSVARMDPARLERVQALALPDRGPVGRVLGGVLGRVQPGVVVRTTAYPAAHGEVPLRVYTPPGPRPAAGRPLVLAFHGGGFVLGSARQGDWASSVVCREVGAVVVSVDYRLAPTHRFPAALDDCLGALLWAVEHAAELGADPERVAVMGESAGGNLAAVVALLARDRGGPRLRHQTLLYPATDLTEALREHDSFAANDHGVVVSLEDLEVFLDHYLPEPGSTAVDASDWRLSPLLAPDLGGLPPALVVVAGLDPLHDSGVRYAEALAAAGVPARVEDFHRMPHGFLGFPHLARSARPAMDAVVAAQRAALG
ncbi:alpha/beta hydrolase [Nocardioides sp. Leaf307]|uniref:alpha/beta hydrolase n=1 Tax=Nocardioides sp. Leaf307 TaxID=1736331 RepID=UPI0007031A89|nr:alpha/beta hydrolase [Nocardioides sp. Leaf307]KQQ41799.1 hypothetical protein ASF50_12865 [Nocardioides sp. Leaf307]